MAERIAWAEKYRRVPNKPSISRGSGFRAAAQGTGGAPGGGSGDCGSRAHTATGTGFNPAEGPEYHRCPGRANHVALSFGCARVHRPARLSAGTEDHRTKN